jgi:hypothetical protein
MWEIPKRQGRKQIFGLVLEEDGSLEETRWRRSAPSQLANTESSSRQPEPRKTIVIGVPGAQRSQIMIQRRLNTDQRSSR